MSDAPVIMWFRRDLRLEDHVALTAALGSGRPVIPLFIHDETVMSLGAAAKWRLGLGVAEFGRVVGAMGSRLILRQGAALAVLQELVAETGAQAVYWTRYYAPDHIARDNAVKAVLRETGIEAHSFAGALLFEPGTVRSGAGTPYSVFTPFWKAIRDRDPGAPLAAPGRLPGPRIWPRSEALDDWAMGRSMGRGAGVVGRHVRVGAAAASDRLTGFLEQRIGHYATGRDFPGQEVTSGLSENLAWGEISARKIWQELRRHREVVGDITAAEKFLSELGWREFSWHQLVQHPQMATQAWRAGWQAFPWRGESGLAEAWRRGMTGEPFVDAAMRALYVTGRIHNRARMVAASYLTKQLLTDWRIGLAWFADCLIDWDPAANALGWQWVAGSGPDAAPYFRVFNPATQAEKFDAQGIYRNRFLGTGQAPPGQEAEEWYEAMPLSWGMARANPYPPRLVSLAQGRATALQAYAGFQKRDQ